MSATKKNTNNKSKLLKLIKDKIERIRLDNTSGSGELSKKAADILIFLVENVSNTSPSDLINLIPFNIELGETMGRAFGYEVDLAT